MAEKDYVCHIARVPRRSRLRRGVQEKLVNARAFGGLSRDIARRLDRLAAGKTKTRSATSGMRPVREWKGTVHVVTAGDNGTVHWNEREWRSLIEVAREITGTRWSGPPFFGLRKKLEA